jgi:hypothetical protein
MRLTIDQLNYRFRLWNWLIKSLPEGMTAIETFSRDPNQHAMILEHVRAFIFDRVDLANHFELLILEGNGGVVRRNLMKHERQSVSNRLFKESQPIG